MTRSDLLNSLDPEELAHWIAKRKIDPKDDGYLQTAVLIQYLLAANGAKQIPKVGDIFRHLKAPEPDPRVIEARMMMWAIQHNAQLERDRQ